ncbi:hypothetical protein [Microbacterium sp. bgisy189]|uniref:hypothetical protein n=1 Tax=Microbacterium sp. bgisy189 TaxID=3413798 RepID=UPI003EB90409
MNIFAATDGGQPSSTIRRASRRRARGVGAALAWDTKASWFVKRFLEQLHFTTGGLRQSVAHGRVAETTSMDITPRESDLPISPEIERVFDLIPEAGEGYRWYDYPYRFLSWLLFGWRRRLFPNSVRTWLNDRLNDLLQFNEHERHKVMGRDSVLENLLVPPDEHVRVGGLWVVELFPPTELPALERAMKRNGWSKPRAVPPHESDNLATLERSRSQWGSRWWRLADVLPPKSNRFYSFHAHKMRLPESFDMVEIRAVQIGQGLTAAVAYFTPTDEARKSLDAVWHAAHEPMLVWENGRLIPLDRKYAAIRRIQAQRRMLRTEARDWLAGKLPGSFAANNEQQLVLELLLLDEFDPTTVVFAEGNERDVRFARANQMDVYRAVGIDIHDFEEIKAKSLPGLILSQPDRRGRDILADDPTWTLWGNTATVAAGFERERELFGGTVAAVGHKVDNFYELLPMLAIVEYLGNADARYARLRDRASTRHGKFRGRALRNLRRSFLTLSLNITSIHRDVNEFWQSHGPVVISDFRIHESRQRKLSPA